MQLTGKADGQCCKQVFYFHGDSSLECNINVKATIIKRWVAKKKNRLGNKGGFG
jgi:hypothetical protein